MSERTRFITFITAITLLLSFLGMSSYAEYDPATALSNYGYVTKDIINLREVPGSLSKAIARLNEYALLEILRTHEVDGDLWYQVDFNGKTGYINGRYVKQLTIKEAGDFINSDLFTTGLEKNKVINWTKEINITEFNDDLNSDSFDGQQKQAENSEIVSDQNKVNTANNDYSHMTDDALALEYNKIRNELFKRTLSFGNGEVLLVNRNDVSVYLTGKYEISKAWDGVDAVSFGAVVINNLEYEIKVEPSVSINGWDVKSYFSAGASAGNKKKGTFMFSLTDADISSFDEISEIEFRISITGVDHLQPITVSFAEK